MTMSAAPMRPVTPQEREAYRRDGAVVLRGVLSLDWIERMRGAVDRALDNPGGASVEYAAQGAGRYLGDFFLWLRDADFRAFALESPLPALARQVMGSASLNLFYDQLLVKEPMTREETPWHQDLPYWPLRGADILSLWTAFDSVSAEGGAMRYVKGSHRAGVMYAPKPFASTSGYADVYDKSPLPPFPDVEAMLADADVLVCPVEPGDVIVHHPLTFHWSPGNLRPDQRRRALALRYIGDDAVFDSRPGTFVENPKVAAQLPEPLAYRDGQRLGGANFPRIES